MAKLTPTAARYRLQVLRAYLTHEKAAIFAIAGSAKEIAEAFAELYPRTIRDLSAAMRIVDTSLTTQRGALASTLSRGSSEIATATMRYHAVRSGHPLLTKAAVQRATTQAGRAIVDGKNVGERITLLSGAQRSATRLRLLQGLRKGEKPEKLIASIQKYYAGAVDGSAGPAYAAKRLVQSELTRLNGFVVEETAYRLRKETGATSVLVYRTQGDERVRDTHSAIDGSTFVEDVMASTAGHSPVSEALSYLGDPNCRCWLDVSSYV